MRLLAYGDSLTAGYCNFGTSFAPWAPTLVQGLRYVNAALTADHIGLSGWTTAQMRDAIDEPTVQDVAGVRWSGYKRQLESGGPYAAVLIMAGTNDFADRTPADKILDNLAALHGVAAAVGARTVAMSVPESAAARHVGWLGELREQTNALLREWAAANGVHFVDSARLVPWEEGSPLWEPDGLHMSCAGYEAFGARLAPLLVDFVGQLGPPSK